MATIDQMFNEIVDIVVEYRPQGEPIDIMFYSYEYDSDTHWIKIGIPSEWCDDENEDEPESYPYTHPIREIPDYSKVKKNG